MPYLQRFSDVDDASVVMAHAENLPFRDAFDLVIATDILEHLLNVGDFMISMRESLTSGARLVVRVPYKDRMLQYARLNGCRYDLCTCATSPRATSSTCIANPASKSTGCTTVDSM